MGGGNTMKKPRRDMGTPLGALLLRLQEWMPIPDFEAAVDAYFRGPRSDAEVNDYRAKRGALKKLHDEVTPVLNYVRLVNAKGEIRFGLGSEFPDCWLRHDVSVKPKGLEVTVALARERYLL